VIPLSSAFGAVLFPKIASQSIPAEQSRLLAQGSRIGVLLSAILAVVAMMTTPLAVPLLFGTEFAPATPVALVLVVASSIAGLNLILEEGMRGLGRTTSVLIAEMGGLAVTAVSLGILLNSLGIMGAALATLLGVASITILLVTQVKGHTRDTFAKLLCPTFHDLTLSWQQVRTLAGIFLR